MLDTRATLEARLHGALVHVFFAHGAGEAGKTNACVLIIACATVLTTEDTTCTERAGDN
jgi:hypothetical protein